MSVTSYKFAGTAATVADSDSTSDLTNPNYAKADDSNFCTFSGGKADVPYYLRLTNFGFSSSDIPSGATINGVELVVSRYSSNENGVADIKFYLLNGSGQTGNNFYSTTKWPTSEGQATYGGATDMLGTSLTQSDIVATTFGVDFKLKLYMVATGYVNYIKIRVYYTEGGGATSLLNSLLRKPFRHMLIR